MRIAALRLLLCACVIVAMAQAVSLPMPVQPLVPPPRFIVPGADPTGVWARIQDRLWNEVFTQDTHYVCNDMRENCACIPEEFAGPNTDPRRICFAYREVRCGFLARKAWRAVFHDAGTFDKTTGKGGMNGSLRYELDTPKNRGTEMGLVVRDVYEAILEDEVETLGRLPNGDARGMADIMVLGGILAVHSCGYPGLMFSPGREDAEGPDDDSVLPGALDDAPTMFRNFELMGLDRVEVVILLAAGHTIAMGLEGAAFDNTPAQFDLAWFGETLAAVEGTGRFNFRPAPFTSLSDAHLVRDPEARQVMVTHATAPNAKASFMELFEKVFYKMVYFGQSVCKAHSSIRFKLEM